jgi:(p)ppGpp synthase/HD superfamily hydrolase
MNDSLIEAAKVLAHRAHAGQTRDDSGDAYIVHPARVAARLQLRFPEDPSLVAAGWCHDVIEDCPQISQAELLAAIGDEALDIVAEVTNPSKQYPELPRAERKAMDRAHIAVISPRARCLKLADRADNLREGCQSPDRKWLAMYAAESQLLLEVLRGTDAELEVDFQTALEEAKRISQS